MRSLRDRVNDPHDDINIWQTCLQLSLQHNLDVLMLRVSALRLWSEGTVAVTLLYSGNDEVAKDHKQTSFKQKQLNKKVQL